MSSIVTLNLLSFLFILLILIQFLSSSRIKIPTNSNGHQRNVLSPRTIKIKYGNCRGSISSLIIIDDVEDDDFTDEVSSNNKKSVANNLMSGKILPSKTSLSNNSAPLPARSFAAISDPGDKTMAGNGQKKENERKRREREAFVEVFKGIPFASPPVGSLRFMPPVTPSYWRGTRLFTSYSPACPQKVGQTDQVPMANNNNMLVEPTRFNGGNESAQVNGSGKSEEVLRSRNGTRGEETNGHSFNSRGQSRSGHQEWTRRRSVHYESSSSRKKYFVSNQSEDCLYLNIFTPFSYESSKFLLSFSILSNLYFTCFLSLILLLRQQPCWIFDPFFVYFLVTFFFPSPSIPSFPSSSLPSHFNLKSSSTFLFFLLHSSSLHSLSFFIHF